jgi:Na+/melibiose symporter-like transporter
VSWARVFASVVASAIGLAFWWALTEPLPVPPVILLGVAGAILFCAGLIAGNGGAIAAPVAFLFSLFIGSIIATQLHQAFLPETAPVEEFNGLISLHFPQVLTPLGIAGVIGAIGGWVGERILPSGVSPRHE